MDNYKGFAPIYDALMTDAPYDYWTAYVDGFLSARFSRKKKSEDKILVLDLACGTGSMTVRLSKLGYDMIGVDISADMLAQASQKAMEEGEEILFIAQDMRELDLYGTVDAAICVCDGMSYILSEAELLSVFKKVFLFLDPGGVFIFDMNSEYKFKELLGSKTFEGKGKGGEAYVWENSYDPKTGINEYNVHFYSGGSEVSFSELHKQRAYDPALVSGLLLDAGFEGVKIRDGYSDKSIKPDSYRIVYIASKQLQAKPLTCQA